jgi:hypothetical protein
MRTIPSIRNEDAVSESLGRIMIFGVIMACIALIYINGNAIINDAQESTNFQGMEQGFQIIGSDLRKTAYEESPMMTSRVNIGFGWLSFIPPGDEGSRLLIYNTAGHVGTDYYPTGQPIYDKQLGSFVYNSIKYGKSIAI